MVSFHLMLLASLMHDITKSEGRVDKTHANYGSFDTFFISQKFNLSKEEEVKLHTIIKQHEWLEYVNSAKTEEDLTKRLQSVAYDLHQGNLFDMVETFTHADLKAVKFDDITIKSDVPYDLVQGAIRDYCPQSAVDQAAKELVPLKEAKGSIVRKTSYSIPTLSPDTNLSHIRDISFANFTLPSLTIPSIKLSLPSFPYPLQYPYSNQPLKIFYSYYDTETKTHYYTTPDLTFLQHNHTETLSNLKVAQSQFLESHPDLVTYSKLHSIPIYDKNHLLNLTTCEQILSLLPKNTTKICLDTPKICLDTDSTIAITNSYATVSANQKF